MKFAIIGSGISGLASAWFLKNEHNVTLFEKENRFGGHANTATVNYNGTQINVDTGFIVFNYKTYFHLQRLFEKLNVGVEKSEMSFGVSNSQIEYSSVFPLANWNIFNGKFLKMALEIVKFNRLAKKLEISPTKTLEDFLNESGFSQYFCNNYIFAMAGAIWSCSAREAGRYPARTFINFFKHHGLLKMFNHPQWYCVSGGSKEYVSKITSQINTVKSKVLGLEKTQNGVKVLHQNGEETFDRVIIATHANEAFKISGQKALEGFAYSKNLAVLHKNESLMPKNKKTWASWNYVSAGENQLNLTYWMNKLQNIPASHPVFVTLNPKVEIAKEDVFLKVEYCHPIFSHSSQEIVENVKKVQGEGGIYYVGSYFGYGFHEDGIKSAYEVCKKFVQKMPW